MDLLIRCRRVLTGDAFIPASVRVRGGLIAGIEDPESAAGGAEVIVLPEPEVLIPGIVDTHVHVNEPGRTEWEGFATATRAAARGGVTTIIDMPLNSVPATTTPDALAIKRERAAAKATVSVGFWGGAVPQNLGNLRSLQEAGVLGFKAFLAPSGVPEFDHLNTGQLETAMTEIAELGSLLIVHAEDPEDLDRHADQGGRDYHRFVRSRPDSAELIAIRRVIDGVRRTGCRTHILHLSSALALPMLREARAEGLPITVETCPHYLVFDAGQIPDGATEFKCCPPIRDRANQDALWAGLIDGTIDTVVTDHSPATIELKRAGDGDFALAWGGISGLEVGFRAVWTEARERGIPLETVVDWMATRTAALVGMADRGAIAPGRRADLVAIDPEAAFTVDVDRLGHRNRISAYDQRTLRGRISRVWLAGADITETPGQGSLLPDRKDTA